MNDKFVEVVRRGHWPGGAIQAGEDHGLIFTDVSLLSGYAFQGMAGARTAKWRDFVSQAGEGEPVDGRVKAVDRAEGLVSGQAAEVEHEGVVSFAPAGRFITRPAKQDVARPANRGRLIASIAAVKTFLVCARSDLGAHDVAAWGVTSDGVTPVATRDMRRGDGGRLVTRGVAQLLRRLGAVLRPHDADDFT